MKKLYTVDLSEDKILVEDYDPTTLGYYGRAFADYLVEKNVHIDTDRYDENNVIVMVTGLLAGTSAPCTGRLTLATKEQKEKGFQVNNLAGSMAQKLASLNICGVVIKGKSKDRDSVITINEDGCYISHRANLKGLKVSETIEYLRNLNGKDSAVVGIGPSGEAQLPLSTIFSTYPEGEPVYHCTRRGIGDVFGSKGLKAIVVQSDGYFNSSVDNKDLLNIESRKLAKIIIDNPICGSALPGYGSITLMKMMKNDVNFEPKKIEKKAINNIYDKKINKTCSPLCVIGCLNRHSSSEEDLFSSPAESEAYAAMKEIFNIDDIVFTKNFNKCAFELGLDSIELIFACGLYLKAENISGTKETLTKLLKDIEELNIVGRIIGSKTQGIFSLYRDKTELSHMVTKPSTCEEKNFNVKLDSKRHFDNMSSLDLLYAKIMMLQDLGFCLFSSFAIIDNEEALETMRNMYYYATGCEIGTSELVQSGLKTIERELDFETRAKKASVQKNIPEFVKVLYRYYNRES